MKAIFYDISIVVCVCLDIGLVMFLIKEAIFPTLDNIFLFLVPVLLFAFSVITLQRKTLFQRRTKASSLLQTAALEETPKITEASGDKKLTKPSPIPKPREEFATHNCPEHGIERCAGNYMNLHSCNSPSNSVNQIYWAEIPPSSPIKSK